METKKIDPIDARDVRDWFFTFGVGHPLARYFVRINGAVDSTREKMFRKFGKAWAFQYPDAASAGVHTYRLDELNIDEVDDE